MKITFLGQAGLLFENKNSKVLIDPYLSDSLADGDPEKSRRQPVDRRFFKIRPTSIIITHCHQDHYDRQTLEPFLRREPSLDVLSPISVWQDVRTFGGRHNYILFGPGTSVSLAGVRAYGVRAEHSDLSAIGVILEDREDGTFYYVTGDTLYHESLFSMLPDFPLKAVFLPVNGRGNNMNLEDAARFAARTRAQFVVPLHFGMFDEVDPSLLPLKNKVIPKIYEEIVLK